MIRWRKQHSNPFVQFKLAEIHSLVESQKRKKINDRGETLVLNAQYAINSSIILFWKILFICISHEVISMVRDSSHHFFNFSLSPFTIFTFILVLELQSIIILSLFYHSIVITISLDVHTYISIFFFFMAPATAISHWVFYFYFHQIDFKSKLLQANANIYMYKCLQLTVPHHRATNKYEKR